MAPRFGATKRTTSWSLKWNPSTIDDLAMHPKKLDEIKEAMKTKLISIISGPPGSSKSTSVKLLAKELNLTVIEFTPPSSNVGQTHVINAFKDFLLGVSFYDPLKTLVIVDELPNVVHEGTREAFEDALLEYAESAGNPVSLNSIDESDVDHLKPSIVVLFTEMEISANYQDAIVVPRILGRVVQDHSCAWVKVNPINATIMSKILKKVINSENLDVSPEELKTIAASGDIRGALTSLEFYAKPNIPKSKLARKKIGPRLKKTINDYNTPNPVMQPHSSNIDSPTLDSSLQLKNTSVNLFHAVGKVIFGSSDPSTVSKSIEGFKESIETFNLTVFENYTSAKRQQLPINTSDECMEWLSLADVNDQIMNIGSLGVALCIEKSEADTKAPSKYKSIQFTQFPKWRAEEHTSRCKAKNRTVDLRRISSASLQDTVLDYLPYERIITNSGVGSYDPPVSFISSDDEF
ncbi:Rad24 protein [Starmerella bacillaris]|uniref:Rad24 protein n=1 Tax=Starmerella bacillaris TaxID=1247836 RepID=A0AAV5RJA1_STABA|nr:Rad24 protein [Starmerella bacillaris]